MKILLNIQTMRSFYLKSIETNLVCCYFYHMPFFVHTLVRLKTNGFLSWLCDQAILHAYHNLMQPVNEYFDTKVIVLFSSVTGVTSLFGKGFCMYVCMYVCIYVWLCVCMHVCINVYMYMYVYIYVIYIYIYIYIHTYYIQTYIHPRIHTYIHCMHTYIHILIWNSVPHLHCVFLILFTF